MLDLNKKKYKDSDSLYMFQLLRAYCTMLSIEITCFENFNHIIDFFMFAHVYAINFGHEVPL